MQDARMKVLRFGAQDVIATSGGDPYALAIWGSYNGKTNDIKITYMGKDYGTSTYATLQTLLQTTLGTNNPALYYGQEGYRTLDVDVQGDEDDMQSDTRFSTDGSYKWLKIDDTQYGFVRTDHSKYQ